MQPNPRSSRPDRAPSGARVGGPSENAHPRSDDAAAVTALWCPHCKTPFVGVISTTDASFVHAGCGGRSVLDMAMLDALAGDSWFWQRYRDRLRGH